MTPTLTLHSAGDRPFTRKLKWALPFCATLLPIILLSFYSYQVGSDSVRDSVETSNLSAAANLSQLMTQDVLRSVSLAHAVAELPGTAEALKQRDSVAMQNRLNAIVLSYPHINRAYVTDKDGVLWSDYPQIPAMYGKHMASDVWIRSVLLTKHNAVSNAYVTPLESHGLVIGIAVPVLDAENKILGTLVFEYDLSQVSQWIQNIRVSHNGYLYVVDPNGTLAAHPQLPSGGISNNTYANVPEMKRAREGNVFTTQYQDPREKQLMIATFQPVAIGGGFWIIVAQQPVEEAFASLQRVKISISIAGGMLTLLTFGMLLALGRTSARNERLNRDLTEANGALRDFASIVSHQLRAPITAMRWILETVFDGTYGPVPSALKEPLQELQEVNMRNHALVSDILNVSRLERGVITAQLATVSLRDIAEDAMKNFREPARKQGIELRLEVPSQDVVVTADREKFAEAVANGISNALKHTKKGAITLHVRSEGQRGFIDVHDTGEGMSPEVLGKLFQRDQILGANLDPEKSAGLGLYIARSFMRLQNGEIFATSEEGKGSTFTYSVSLAVKRA